MSYLFRSTNNLLWKRAIYNLNSINNSRCISTSDKKSETVAPTAGIAKSESKTQAVDTNKNWVSYGFDYKNESEDRSSMKSSFFFSVTLCLVWGTFVWSYLPDNMQRDWSQREGFLELRRREAAGLDLISPDYVDPASIELPSDEDLADTEIII